MKTTYFQLAAGLLMGLVALPAAVAIEQSAWKPLNTMITARGAPIRAVGVDVAISYEGKFVPGEVILWGSVGSKILNANLLLDGLHELFPKQDLYDFFGPEESPRTHGQRPFRISIQQRGSTPTFSSSMRIGSCELLYGEPRIKSSGDCFETTNYFASDRKEGKPWRAFLNRIAAGFESGSVDVAYGRHGELVHVEFSGDEAGPVIQNLLKSIYNDSR